MLLAVQHVLKIDITYIDITANINWTWELKVLATATWSSFPLLGTAYNQGGNIEGSCLVCECVFFNITVNCASWYITRRTGIDNICRFTCGS